MWNVFVATPPPTLGAMGFQIICNEATTEAEDAVLQLSHSSE